jgi:hypothetical protein
MTSWQQTKYCNFGETIWGEIIINKSPGMSNKGFYPTAVIRVPH